MLLQKNSPQNRASSEILWVVSLVKKALGSKKISWFISCYAITRGIGNLVGPKKKLKAEIKGNQCCYDVVRWRQNPLANGGVMLPCGLVESHGIVIRFLDPIQLSVP